jgi:menaquinone-dependent protoporphyrinogen oxidase
VGDRTRLLVTYASKMGSTQEIAEAIGRELEAFGMQVTVARCADNVGPEDFDGVIIGSAIYTQRWVKAATKYLKRNAPRLDRHRTWLFTAVRAAKERATSRSRLRKPWSV